MYGSKKREDPGFFQLRGAAPLSKDGSIPTEIDRFLRTLSKDPLWNRHFASVATDIRLPLGGRTEASELDFTITGRRKGDVAAAPAKGGKGDK